MVFALVKPKAERVLDRTLIREVPADVGDEPGAIFIGGAAAGFDEHRHPVEPICVVVGAHGSAPGLWLSTADGCLVNRVNLTF